MSTEPAASVDRVHLVVPDGVDDPDRPSGGNVYDRELAHALRSLGVTVEEHPVTGSWPHDGDPAALAGALAGLSDGAAVVVDGLVGLPAHRVLEAERGRLVLLLLVHLPLTLATPQHPQALAGEHRALNAAAGAITTSEWTRRWLLSAHGLHPGRVRVARPGARRGAPARTPGTTARFLCVGAVTAAKGHDVLVDALATVQELPWSCRVVGPQDRDPDFVGRLREHLRATGLAQRVRLVGPLRHEAMTAAYGAAGLLVHPTRLETYGMVVTEALAHGVPVVASDAGGVAEALGSSPDGDRPGVLVPAGDAGALGVALRRWLTDPGLRDRLRASAAARRLSLADWTSTATHVLEAVAAARLNSIALPTVV